MDPDGKWISTRAVLLAAAGQNCWPPAGSYMAATGQDLMAADTHIQVGGSLPGQPSPRAQFVFRAALTSTNGERFFHLRTVRMTRAKIWYLR